MRGACLAAALRRLGQVVSLQRPGEAAIVSFGVLQALPLARAAGEQFVPTALGLVREERFLYLGEATVSLLGMEEGFLDCAGQRYRIESAQAVYVGKRLAYWRALLRVWEGAVL